jgi:large subunit ribosomal protein L5
VVNVGINKTKMDGKDMQEYIEESLKKITGQKPQLRPARKAISNFKIREGSIVGAKVTLRGKSMEYFLDRLLSYALPRIRDFRGLKTDFDGKGNYSLGLKDHSVFPEVPPPEAGKIFGMQVVVSTTANNDEEGRALLKAVGFPFRPEKEAVKEHKASTPPSTDTAFKPVLDKDDSSNEMTSTESDSSDTVDRNDSSKGESRIPPSSAS